MISLEQIQLLESRVMKAVRRIETLQSENDTLRERLERYEKRIEELEVLINEFKDGQSEIEQGIMNALSQLDNLEDQVTENESVSAGEVDGGMSEATPKEAGQPGHTPNTSRAFDESGKSKPQSDSVKTTESEQKSNVGTPGSSQSRDSQDDNSAGGSDSDDDAVDSDQDADTRQSAELDIF